jgi:hypothetical protein
VSHHSWACGKHSGKQQPVRDGTGVALPALSIGTRLIDVGKI